jgi:tetratricopeptide (TPR) repeat protein
MGQEGYMLALRIGDQAVAASCAFNLGHAYKDVPALRDLEKAEQWYRRSLELTPENDHLGRGQTFSQLGFVAYERFNEARQAGLPSEVLQEHLGAALQAYQEALSMTPPDALDSLVVKHNQLGLIYAEVLPDYLEQALAHYHEAIRYDERAGNHYGAAQTRQNVAIAYARAGRFEDALLFAHTRCVALSSSARLRPIG